MENVFYALSVGFSTQPEQTPSSLLLRQTGTHPLVAQHTLMRKNLPLAQPQRMSPSTGCIAASGWLLDGGFGPEIILLRKKGNSSFVRIAAVRRRCSEGQDTPLSHLYSPRHKYPDWGSDIVFSVWRQSGKG